MLTGKDVYEAARPNIVKHGFEDLEWEDFVPEAQEFYVELAARLNKSHIAPLQGLAKDLERTLVYCWNNEFPVVEVEKLRARVEQLCGEEPKS